MYKWVIPNVVDIGATHDGILIVIGNGLHGPSSNLGQDPWKSINPTVLLPAMGK